MPELKQPFSLKQFFGRIALLLVDSDGTDIEALGEADGTLKASNYGKAGATLTAFKLETTGEQDLVLHGKDSGGNIDPLRTNANQQLQVEIIHGQRIQVDPALVPSSEGILWNPGTTSAELYEVHFKVVNSTATAVSGFNIGQDIGGAGSLSAVEYWHQGIIIPANGEMDWNRVPFLVPGDDDVRGVAGTNNALTVHWNIKQVY